MNNIYQVEFVDNTESNNVETLIRFYITDDIGKILNSVKNDKDLKTFTISYLHNLSNSLEVKIL